ncbi:DNRLRE domain-containing protein [Promicromonospora kroppenstedtii]|uniref:DNRLRE domain-containing protein n=1 Tax=Promicromonospora kroppenstedtii TaxID=440482 RepID=UPI0012FB369F
MPGPAPGIPTWRTRASLPLKVRDGIANAFVWLRSPVPAGATVTSATLTLTARGSVHGHPDRQCSPGNCLVEGVPAQLDNMPAGGPSAGSAVVGSLSDGDTVQIDVTSFVQAWAGGLQNYGWRIATTATATHQFYGFNSANGRPSRSPGPTTPHSRQTSARPRRLRLSRSRM